MNVLGIDRVIIATDDMNGAADRFSELLGLTFGERIEATTQTDAGEQSVANRFSSAGLELVTPQSDEGEIARFLAARGPGLYAISFRVSDTDVARDELEAHGIDPVGHFESGGVTELFYHPQSFEGAFVILAEYDAPHPMETALK